MIKFFLLDETGGYELESIIDRFNEETYNYVKKKEPENKTEFSKDSVNMESISEVSTSIKISKFKKYIDIHGIHFAVKNLLCVCKLTGYPEIWLNSIDYFDKINNVVNLRGEDIKQLKMNDDLVVVKQKTNGLFVQPTLYFSLKEMGHYICFEIDIRLIDENSNQILGEAQFLGIFDDLQNDVIKSAKSWRFVLNVDVIENDDKFSNEILEKYKFQKFTEIKSMKSFFISKEFENISEILTKDPFFDGKILTLLQTFETVSLIPYDFNEPFSGWSSIVFPFISFVFGLSHLAPTVISGRFVHLPQSSGHGKTRICFELLKYVRKGVFCVYRSNSNSGYPKTTPWFENLFGYFKMSKSNTDSMILCARFILYCVDNFKTIEGLDFSMFDGSYQGVAMKNNFTFKEDTSADKEKLFKAIISQICSKIGNGVFPMIFDECHEMLITPDNKPDLLNLYRIMRRVLFNLKETRIVAIFLGTKSSLSDFILNHRIDPSIREILGKTENFIDVPCYIFTQNIDAMFTEPYLITYEACALIKIVEGAHISHPMCLKEIARNFGRPLWTRYSFEYSIQLALFKLETDRNIFELACLVLRTGSQVVPQDELAHKLVLSSMATLLHVDIEGSRCLIEYIPEPILSNAARMALTNINTLDKAIKDYIRRLQIGSFHDSGYSGELVARIILLRVMDLSVLKLKISPDEDKTKSKDVNMYSFTEIFGNSDEKLKIGARFLEKSRKIFSKREKATKKFYQSPTLSTNQVPAVVNVSADFGSSKPETATIIQEQPPIDPEKSKFLSPYIGTSTVREYLMFLANLEEKIDEVSEVEVEDKEVYFDVDMEIEGQEIEVEKVREEIFEDYNGNSASLWKLGVSDEVLDGFVSFNQFVQMKSPMVVNQQYLLHFFTRSCAMILAKGAEGADLVVPVLRTDNRMSCIVIQVKNYGYDGFPHKSVDTASKLNSSFLKYLNLNAIADFEGIPADDFVRVVIQFTAKSEKKISKNTAWVAIPKTESNSQHIPDETKRTSPRLNPGNKQKCHALWLRGLDCFEPLFFGNQAIINNLNIILDGQRDFLSAVQYPEKKLPTLLQTSLEGARFLAFNAQTLASYDNIVVHDAQLRDKCVQKGVYYKYLNDLDKFMIPRISLNDIQYCTLTTNENTLKKQLQSGTTLNIHSYDEAPQEIKNELEKIITSIIDNNFEYAKWTSKINGPEQETSGNARIVEIPENEDQSIEDVQNDIKKLKFEK